MVDRARRPIRSREARAQVDGVLDPSVPEDGVPEVPAVETPLDETPVGDIPAGEVPVGDVPSGEVPVGDVPSGEVPGGSSPVEDSPVAGSSVAGSPVAGSPVAGSPVAGSSVSDSQVQKDVPVSGVTLGSAPTRVVPGENSVVSPVGSPGVSSDEGELERIRGLARAQGFVLFREPRTRQFRPEPDARGGIRTSCRLSSGVRRELELARLHLNMSYSEIIEQGIYMFLESQNLLSEPSGDRS